jgi:16S rRNA (cytosine1402-N4)-methyltransferase
MENLHEEENEPISSGSISNYHIPVLLNETLEALDIKADGVYVDCTFGGGGHSKAILERLDVHGKLIVFDQDEDARKNVPNDDRIVFVPQNFRHLQKFLRLQKAIPVDGILADLGVSSHQFDEADRGFSIRFDAALDMRMDNRQTLTAADILNSYSETELHKLFEKYGEVTNAKTLARTIVDHRLIAPFKTILAFKQALQGIVKGNPNKYFAQVFQALRIQVNDEMKALEEMLEQTASVLKPGGRLAIISFHSLEDRIVKNYMKFGANVEPEADDVFGTRPDAVFKIISKKPITASGAELKKNPRSRSAKLRVAAKK